MNMPLIQIQCSVPSKKTAKKIAKKLVEEQLCACVNILPKMSSFYIYEGEFCEDEELLLLIKTDKTQYDAVEKWIFSLHPYAVPEIIVLPVLKGAKDYLNWAKKAL
ncbi:MAG: divalent-cation tolerance protein CutA, partial [Thiovulaceae bacterium]|nr:divalent-cation tolerance protein CutA [Sulfurimonadaceae bacterium]